MGESKEELEEKINALYKEIEALDVITDEYRQIVNTKAKKGEKNEKIYKLSSLIKTFGTKFQNKYTKLATYCLNLLKKTFKENLNVSYNESLFFVLLESFGKFSTGGKDENGEEYTFVKYLNSRFGKKIQEEKIKNITFEKFGTEKRQKWFEKLLQIKKIILEESNDYIDLEKESSKFEKYARDILSISEDEIKSLLKKFKTTGISNNIEDIVTDSCTVGDFIQDTKNISDLSIITNEDSLYEFFNLLDEFFKDGLRKSTEKENTNLNRAANIVYIILIKILFKIDRVELLKLVEQFDFLKICKKGILKLYDDKSLGIYEKDISKKDFAATFGIPSQKLSDGYSDGKDKGQLGKISLYFVKKVKDLEEDLKKYSNPNSLAAKKIEDKIDLIKKYF